MVTLRRMVGLLVAADDARLEPWNDSALGQVGEAQRAVDFALQNREAIPGPCLALLLTVDPEDFSQVFVAVNCCRAGFSLRQLREAIPEGPPNGQGASVVILPKQPFEFAFSKPRMSSQQNGRLSGAVEQSGDSVDFIFGIGMGRLLRFAGRHLAVFDGIFTVIRALPFCAFEGRRQKRLDPLKRRMGQRLAGQSRGLFADVLEQPLCILAPELPQCDVANSRNDM